MEIITRAEAKARGLKRYFTGKPCERGHVAERHTVNANCTQCALEVEAERRIAIPEKVREQQRQRRAANPGKHSEQRRQRRAVNLEKHRERDRQRRNANLEKARERDRQRYAANPEKFREQQRQRRDAKYCVKIVDRIDRGLESTKASGTLLDIHTAIDLFKSQHNAFEFLEAGTS